MIQVAAWTGMCIITLQRKSLSALMNLSAVGLLIADVVLFAFVAFRLPPEIGDIQSLPSRIREFGHVYYLSEYHDLDQIDQHNMTAPIFPTALFLKK